VAVQPAPQVDDHDADDRDGDGDGSWGRDGFQILNALLADVPAAISRPESAAAAPTGPATWQPASPGVGAVLPAATGGLMLPAVTASGSPAASPAPAAIEAGACRKPAAAPGVGPARSVADSPSGGQGEEEAVAAAAGWVAPLAGLLPLDLGPVEQGVEALWARLAGLGEAPREGRVFAAMALWAAVTAAAAWDLARAPRTGDPSRLGLMDHRDFVTEQDP
jgi:hypothetical protein